MAFTLHKRDLPYRGVPGLPYRDSTRPHRSDRLTRGVDVNWPL